MSSRTDPRFDPDLLRTLGGDKVYARGEAYFRDDLVNILDFEPGRVVARVAGTEDYRTVVSGQACEIDGECDCPAFDREGFCKHMVAVALAANAAEMSGETGSGGTLARIRDYLRCKDIDDLIEMIIQTVERDPALFRRLEIAATATAGDGKSIESRLRSAISDATRTGGFVDYGRAAGWAAGVDAALDLLAELASGPQAAVVVELADLAAARIERAIEDIDDSDGHCGALLERTQRIHLEACRAARPEPVALARDLFLRETEGDFDTFYAAAPRYAEVLGEAGLAEYRRLAQEAWSQLPARIGPSRGGETYRSDHVTLASILDYFAERDGDVDTRIALRAKFLSSQWDFVRLAEFCQAHRQEEEALRRAEEGVWLFEDDRPDERLVLLLVDLLLRADRNADAETHLWRAFAKAPSLRLVERMRDIGGHALVRRAIEHLQAELGRVSLTRWHNPADLLVRILLEEAMFDEAWAIVDRYGVSASVAEALAMASEQSHPRRALAVYADQVETLAQAGGNPAYQEAAALVARMARLRTDAEQADYLAGLKSRHGRKRNLMKLLA